MSEQMLNDLLGSKGRSEIFRILFGVGPTEIHLREIVRNSQLSLGTIQQELKKLTTLQLVITRRDGNRLYYRANSAHPLYSTIRDLVVRTTGVAYMIQTALQSSAAPAGPVRCAFIFGSIARGEEKPESDVDLMVVGELGLRKLSQLLSGLGNQVGREINPHVFSPDEFRARVKKQDHFLGQVLSDKKLFLIGDNDELEAMAR